MERFLREEGGDKVKCSIMKVEKGVEGRVRERGGTERSEGEEKGRGGDRSYRQENNVFHHVLTSILYHNLGIKAQEIVLRKGVYR